MDTRDDIDTQRVELGARGYDILIGEDLLAAAGTYIRPLVAQPRVAVVTDTNVAQRWLPALEKALGQANIVHDTIVLPAGEHTKDLAHLEDLTNRLLDARIERATALIALGGGVVGDITGFAAAILLRGLDFVHIPTTLLAQVDSSVGGKTGINTRHGKNLIGAFHQPRLVLADVGTLETLDQRHFLAGYAETVKYGLLGDPQFFAWLETKGADLCAGDRQARRHAVRASCAAKAAIVADDERESGRRQLLNLGHTFGHALEAQTGFSDALLHGEAVAIGMVLAFDLSVRLGLCPPGDARRARRHLAERGLPVSLTGLAGPDWTADGLFSHMLHDKKARGGRPTLVLARGIGQAFTTSEVEAESVRTVLDDALKG
ncbi:MAG: 3-dehydroquinate synthase [Rhodospirillales bacterium]|nr:3-dehydroquinate synthase [Rhodospirillales bacterium]